MSRHRHKRYRSKAGGKDRVPLVQSAAYSKPVTVRLLAKLHAWVIHRLHAADHYLHMCYLACVAAGGPYYYVAGALFLVELIGIFIHEEV